MMNIPRVSTSPVGGLFAPADAFIRDLLRAEFGGETPCPPRPAPPPSPGWDAIVRRASGLGIAPLLYGIVQARPGIGIPERHARLLGAAYAKSWAMNAKTRARLSELLTLFTSAGIRVILLKGAHLAFLVYRDIGMRSMVDVDILVRVDDLPAAEKLLAGAGYTTRPHVPQAYDFMGSDTSSLGPGPLAARYRERHHHLHPMGSARGIRILDVHRTLASPSLPFSIDTGGLWERAERCAVEGAQAEVLCPEDAVLNLALHVSAANRFRVSALRSLCDIAAVAACNRATPDWGVVRARAREWNAERSVYLSLLLAADICGARIPAEGVDPLRPVGFNDVLVAEAVRRVLPPRSRGRLARLLPASLVPYARSLRLRVRRGSRGRSGRGLDSWLGAENGVPGRER